MASSKQRFVLAFDQGTTGSAALVFDREGLPVAEADYDIRQSYPRPGWVSHDPEEIYQSCLAVARRALERARVGPGELAAIGITNQRETTLVWDRATGRPIADAVVWQCRRSAPYCRELTARGLGPTVRAKTGLLIDAYFSGTKIRWLLDNVEDARARADAGDLAFGTVDSWLLWRLSGGRAHLTDLTNAARTMLFNIHEHAWDADLLRELDIPAALLPEVRPSSGLFCELSDEARTAIGGVDAPITGVAGDQHAALFGQACFRPGMAKNTYGTGSFLLLNTGARAVSSERGLLTTVAWGLDGGVEYALEGSVFVTGAAVQWLRDGLGIIASAADTEAMANAVRDTGGVYFVPAFAGLGAPHWDMDARGAIVGLTGGTTREHLVRATLEAIAYQTVDVLQMMRQEGGIDVSVLRVDGGGSANEFLMQFQADVLDIPIEVAQVQETTARGAAYLAGLGVGFWDSRESLAEQWRPARRFSPKMAADRRAELLGNWHRAVERARGWAQA